MNKYNYLYHLQQYYHNNLHTSPITNIVIIMSCGPLQNEDNIDTEDVRERAEIMRAYFDMHDRITRDKINKMREILLKLTSKGKFDARIDHAFKLVVVQLRMHASPLDGYLFRRCKFPTDPTNTYDESIHERGIIIFNDSPLCEVVQFYCNQRLPTGVSPFICEVSPFIRGFAAILDKAQRIYNNLLHERKMI